jgi:hypothetical protein
VAVLLNNKKQQVCHRTNKDDDDNNNELSHFIDDCLRQTRHHDLIWFTIPKILDDRLFQMAQTIKQITTSRLQHTPWDLMLSINDVGSQYIDSVRSLRQKLPDLTETFMLQESGT